MVTGTILPFGGHKILGVEERAMTGGVVSRGPPLFNSTPTEARAQVPASSAHWLATSRSGLPSPFTSVTATELVKKPPVLKVTACWKVPSPLPKNTATAPTGEHDLS